MFFEAGKHPDGAEETCFRRMFCAIEGDAPSEPNDGFENFDQQDDSEHGVDEAADEKDRVCYPATGGIANCHLDNGNFVSTRSGLVRAEGGRTAGLRITNRTQVMILATQNMNDSAPIFAPSPHGNFILVAKAIKTSMISKRIAWAVPLFCPAPTTIAYERL